VAGDHCGECSLEPRQVELRWHVKQDGLVEMAQRSRLGKESVLDRRERCDGVGIRDVISNAATTANMMMPLLYESRSPRLLSWPGRFLSRARIAPNNGNPLKAVLAARTRINAVVACT